MSSTGWWRARTARVPMRIAACGIAAALAAAAAGCGAVDNHAPAAAHSGAANDGKPPSVYLLNAYVQDTFWQGCSKGAKQAAADLGVTDYTELDGNNSSQTQAGQIDTAIEKKPDAILIAALDSKAVVPALTAARKQGIKVYAFNTAVPDAHLDGTVAMDEVATGAAAARQMIALAQKRGLTQLRVLHLVGAVATEPVRLRRQGFDDQMAKPVDGLKITVTDKVTDWKPEKAVSALEDTLTRQKIDAIFTESDFLTPFLVPVLKREGFKPQPGRRPIIGGLGGIPGGFKAIRDGWQDFTLNYQIDGMCDAAMRFAAAAKQGKPFGDVAEQVGRQANLAEAKPKVVENAAQGPSLLLTATLVTKANVDDPALWANKLTGG